MATSNMQQMIQELASTRRQNRIWQLSITLLLLILVVGCLLTLRNAAYNLANEGAARDAFVKDLGTRLQRSTLPDIEQMGTQALHEIDFQAEVQKLNRRAPELAQASMQQITLLGKDLPERGKKVFDNTFSAALKQREGKIKAMFPDATPDKVTEVMATLTNEAQTQVGDISGSLFSAHKEALDGIVTDVNRIQLAEAPSTSGEVPTWEMALMIFDIARADLKGLEPTETKPKQKSHAKEAKK
jgi:hypothetical protein